MIHEVDVRPIPEIDQGKLPIWQLDELGMSELAWRDRTLKRGDRSRLPKSLFSILRLKDQLPEFHRKVYPDLIRPTLTPEMLVGAGVIPDLSLFEKLDGALTGADKFAQQSLRDMLCYNLLVKTARVKTGEEKLRLMRLGFGLADWPSKLPELKLKATDLDDANEVLGCIYDHILTSDFALGFEFRDLQRVLAKKYPMKLCPDCGVSNGCECAEIKHREKTGNFKVEVTVDEWQATQQSLYGLACQMRDQFEPKNEGRGKYYEFHRTGYEHVEFAQWVLTEDHEVRENIDIPQTKIESADRRIWFTVLSLPLQLNLYAFLVARYERMAEKRKQEQAALGGIWKWDGPGWNN